MLNITISKQTSGESQAADRLVVVFSGDLDNAACNQVQRDLAPVFECTDCDIVIDCTELNFICSGGLRIVLIIFKHATSNGHQAILKGMQENVREIFFLSGFLQLFVIEK